MQGQPNSPEGANKPSGYVPAVESSHVLSPDIVERIHVLEKKYAARGQDMRSYLDGLIHSDFLTYWDYTHLDVLLSLQNPRTTFPDEKIFILYHQITELYFKLILNEIEQVAFDPALTAANFKLRLRSVINYFRHLTSSFSIMIDGMEKEQFLQFRMALLPASGFQSAQYRMIELTSTDTHNLVAWAEREKLRGENDNQTLLDNRTGKWEAGNWPAVKKP